MRSGVLVTGVLGLGTALVFGAAALTASLFPNGTVVQTSWGGGWGGPMIEEGGWIKGGGWAPGAEPIPMPLVIPEREFIEGDVFVDGVHVAVDPALPETMPGFVP